MLYKVKKNEELFSYVKQHVSSLDTSCGGRGTCGKCKILVIEGNLSITKEERLKLTQEELDQGVRLACLHSICEEDIAFTLVHENTGFVIEGNGTQVYETNHEEGYAIAIDVGTTTVVMNVLNLSTGIVEKEISFLNPQKVYGADVISRVDHANKEGIKPLQKILLDKIEKELHTLPYEIKRMCVCGNAVMTHIFLGEDPSSIAIAPYTCKVKEYVEVDSKTLFCDVTSFPVQVLPPISAYVGSDIVMDLYDTSLLSKENTLLIDLGTNGEIALCKDHTLYVSSAACGPAFEGGNMSCGSGACEGAIDFVSYDTTWKYTTIADKTPIRVCGSGYMSWISKALEMGWIDESGYMEEDISLTRDIHLTQKDVREFQLAKGAIAAAVETLCHKAKIAYKDIEQLYIAGGFGTHIQKRDLAILGIIPMALLPKIKTLGNSALKGVCKYAITQDLQTIQEILENSENQLLASDPKFTELFMMSMMFENVYES